ncbi:MAG: GNAT family N-acetyltransferase, partial [Cytophagaceae bacterium]
MRLIVCENDDTKPITEMCLMFAARKSIFVDLLGWNLPVRGERYEVDQFDDTHARYLMIMCDGKHTASTRLLPTTKPHILESLFSHLCKEPVPMGPGVLEITRFCVDRDQPSSRRRIARSL